MSPPPPDTTSFALRKPRKLLGWTQKDLATRSGVRLEQIRLHEARPGQLLAARRTIDALRHTLEDAEIEFIVGSHSDARLKTETPKS
jgi:transcriptional regulator with XRE-family HTH domain